MKLRLSFTLLLLALILAPMLVCAQVNFKKHNYYVGMGDSVAAGEGAMPVTNGYVYRLYNESAFGKKKEMDFANMGTRGARSWDLRDHQVPQVLCAEPEQRPTVVTITAGANDFFRNDPDVASSAQRVAQAVDRLLNNETILDPVTGKKCRALENVTILVSNYYIIPHPVPEMFQMLDTAVQGFNQALEVWVKQVVVPSGSRVAVVDLYTPSLGRQGLVTIERRLGFVGPFDFDIHPTNLGHAFIAGEFKKVWNSLP